MKRNKQYNKKNSLNDGIVYVFLPVTMFVDGIFSILQRALALLASTLTTVFHCFIH